jgi:trigger factor
MKTYKSHLCFFIAFAILFVLLTGCSAKTDAGLPTPSPSVPIPSASDPSATDPSASNIGQEIGSFSYSDGLDENGLWAGITALDYVKLYDYNAFAIPSETHTVSDDDIQYEVDSLLTDYATSEQITDRAVIDGDTVNIDFVGSVDGVEFDGGSTGGGGAEVTIGVTSYIDDFLEQLIGHNPGETFDINVTFPEDYGEESLNGKDAVFVTTVNHIVETTDALLSDAFVAENLYAEYGWQTIAEMKDGITAALRDDAIENYILEYLYSEVAVEPVPDHLVTYQNNAMIKYYQNVAESLGVELEEFLSSYIGVSSLDELIDSDGETNMIAAKYSLIIQAIAEDTKITASDADVTAYFVAEAGIEDYSEYEAIYGLPYLKQIVLTQKVMDYLTAHVRLV